MKTASILSAFFAVVSASPLDARQGANGNGPYGAVSVSTDSSLSNHAIYIPDSSKTGSTKLPVLVWGNGGCGGDGASNAKFLGQVASNGYLVIASGRPGGSGSTTAQMMTQSIDFAVKVAGTGKYANVDATKIMAAGFSCGGVEAMAQSWDARVKTIGIFSSGLLTNYTAASTFTKPILYCIGGSGDVAYNNAERDFKALSSNTPAWKGNLPLGHGGDLFSTNGGKFGKAGINWMNWLFKGDETAAAYFTSGYKSDGWSVETHALDKLKPF
ncbi:alpha/beta-hydrolase [Echria macrotheca]|uniref:Alpha/beta-hydrolase n=1 Tax=Echria macrotheca TaxID=438768 RepID=A0AAJ0B5S9_9PEZI|nr:alpha/beta-hydrolase [Echria macrotheca]